MSNKFVFENDDEKLLNFSLEKISKYKDHMENQSIDKAIKESFELITEINVYIDNQTPWLLKKTNIERMNVVLSICIELIKRSSFYIFDKYQIKKKLSVNSFSNVYDLQTSKRSSSYLKIFYD